MNQCDFPKCKNPSNFGYIEHNICASHWIMICEAKGKTEKSLLKKIDLIRNKEGSVVTIRCKKT